MKIVMNMKKIIKVKNKKVKNNKIKNMQCRCKKIYIFVFP